MKNKISRIIMESLIAVLVVGSPIYAYYSAWSGILAFIVGFALALGYSENMRQEEKEKRRKNYLLELQREKESSNDKD